MSLQARPLSGDRGGHVFAKKQVLVRPVFLEGKQMWAVPRNPRGEQGSSRSSTQGSLGVRSCRL